MLTYTGQRFNPWYPEQSKININDIAHALAHICRFGGHLADWYNVAHHSIIVSKLCKPENALIGLMHDAAEAYIGDMVSPIKRTMPDFIELERIVHNAISERFGLSQEMPSDVKDADNKAYAIESWSFRNTTIADPDRQRMLVSDSARLYPMDRNTAEVAFLARFNELTGENASVITPEELGAIYSRNRML